MTDASPRIAQSALHCSPQPVEGEYVSLGNERFYRIANYDRMNAFFMTIVSASNHWMFLSSQGGLTAGRQNSDNALFPYYTEDKIHDGSAHTGARSVLRVYRGDECFLWEPFAPCFSGGRSLYNVTRSLYKNIPGNIVRFEEVNHDLGLRFSYSWKFSDRFGFVKHSQVENRGSDSIRVEVLDGIENLLPSGISEAFQNAYSCLGDAYKQNECEADTGIATFAFSSLPGDNPEPSEALRATVCWSTAAGETRLLSSLQLDAFRFGGEPSPESRICGRRGAYFVHQEETLATGDASDWLIVADLDYGLPEIAQLRKSFADRDALKREVLEDVDAGTERLKSIVARADGLQVTGDEAGAAHHFANVLFNVMRGGIFESGYAIPTRDLTEHIRSFNEALFLKHEAFLKGLGDTVALDEVVEKARALQDPDLYRLVLEYLPISFSRRHGDPSRPWNKFSINVKHRDGTRILDYQGNWRDIFQNWEALCLSFPEYVESIIAKFLNTTTADGYNPYRVTKRGYEWEAPDPDDPWAHFGYWGDHQIIYLLKLLELSRRHHPRALEEALDEEVFVYAEVPYDIKPYEDLLADPRNSVVYNREREAAISQRVEQRGLDGKYLAEASGSLTRANLAEKLLLPLLTKLGNFVPGAGFWMNTQRPEWNDANNALAGYGASVVTLCYARRYVTFVAELLRESGHESITLDAALLQWLQATMDALDTHRGLLDEQAVGDAARKKLVDSLASAASHYRSALYARGLSGQRDTLDVDKVLALLELSRAFFDHTIGLNRRDDGLYHAYNVLVLEADAVRIERLQPMLEGQVAVLSSGALDAAQSLSVLQSLRGSDLYRADQHSYLLYPDKTLPGFMEKNTIPAELAQRSTLLQRLIEDDNRSLVERDIDGALHFNGLFKNVRDVHVALAELRDAGYADLVASESALVAEIFESVFNHRMFTGRSGTFYGYEGLGCIYWHMVSKLLLATQEAALHQEIDPSLFDSLSAAYYDVRSGIGFNKTPDVYGAFPTDPYSHTPGYAGAKQPGMTGQVKEEVITRFGELGVTVSAGRLRFTPTILRDEEFLQEAVNFDYFDVRGEAQSLSLTPGMLAFTYCQVPVVYQRGATPQLSLHRADGTEESVDGTMLDQDTSRSIFQRSGDVQRIAVTVPPGLSA